MTCENDFAERLQQLIDTKKIEQKDLAEAIEKRPAQISKWLSRSVGTPRRQTIVKIAQFFECNLEWLATGKGKPYPSYAPPAGNAINFDLGKKDPLAKLDPKLKRMAEWIDSQEDDLDYWGWMEMEFSEKFTDYKSWLKEQHQEKKETTGTDN